MSQYDEGFSHAAGQASRSGFKFARQLSEPAHKTAKPLKPILKKSRTEPVKRLSALLAAHLPGFKKELPPPPPPPTRMPTERSMTARNSMDIPRGRIPLRARDSIHVSKRRPSDKRSLSTSTVAVPEAEKELIWSPGWSKVGAGASSPKAAEISSGSSDPIEKTLPPVPGASDSYFAWPPSSSRSKSGSWNQKSTIPFPTRQSFTFTTPAQAADKEAGKPAMKSAKRSRLASSIQTNWKESFEKNSSQFFNQSPGEVRFQRSLSRGSSSGDDASKRSPSQSSAPRKKRRVSFTVPEGHREEPPIIIRRPTPYYLPLQSKLSKLFGSVVDMFRRKDPEEQRVDEELERKTSGGRTKKNVEVFQRSSRQQGVSAH